MYDFFFNGKFAHRLLQSLGTPTPISFLRLSVFELGCGMETDRRTDRGTGKTHNAAY